MKHYILIAIALFVLGCDNEVNPSIGTVHLAGSLGIADTRTVASYWKDGAYFNLAPDAQYSQVSSLYVDGSSVSIGGVRTIEGSPGIPPTMIWQDGVGTVIDEAFGDPLIGIRDNNIFGAWLSKTNGWVYHKNATSQPLLDTAYEFAPMAMTLNGDDIYTAGYSSGPALPPNYAPYQHAQYWKNDKLMFRESEVSNALCILKHRDAIYMAGYSAKPGDINNKACYWKNGQLVNLTDGSYNAIARSISVTDDQVYVSGLMNNQAVYWRDGEAVFLTTESTASMANSIFVRGTDVHVGGYEDGHPAYWKNDVKQRLESQDLPGQILFVVVGSN